MNAMTINEAIAELKIQKRGVLLDDRIKEQDKNDCVEAIDIAISSLKREHRPSVKAEFPPDARNVLMTRSETIERLNIMLEQLEPIRTQIPTSRKIAGRWNAPSRKCSCRCRKDHTAPTAEQNLMKTTNSKKGDNTNPGRPGCQEIDKSGVKLSVTA